MTTTDHLPDAVAVHTAWEASPVRHAIARAVREAGWELYAVGGAVRDVLLGREVHDWDMVGPEAMSVAHQVASDMDGVLVPLHNDPPIARVVFGTRQQDLPQEELDFGEYCGGTLTADLQSRDFTINSLAWRVGDEGGVLVDVCGGLADLRERRIRANSAKVLSEDPLRCLRAFRLAAELGFDIENQTLSWIRESAEGLREVAGERIGAEVVRLAGPRGLAQRLQQMDAAGVLPAILPELEQLKGVQQGGYHHLDVWGHTLLTVEEVERIAASPETLLPAAAPHVREYLARPGTEAQVKLAALLHDIGKPACRTEGEGRARFIGHETTGAEIALAIAQRLRLPRVLRELLVAFVQQHMRPIMLIDATEPNEPSAAAVRRLVRNAAPDGIGLMILAAADLRACLGPATVPAQQAERLGKLDAMIGHYAEAAQRQRAAPLLRGRDLISELKLEPGPLFSRILHAVEEERAEGRLTTRLEALEYARQIVESTRSEK